MRTEPSANGAASGFGDPQRAQQMVFRAAMSALAEPGRMVPLPSLVSAPQPLGAGAASLVLALADYETTLWLDGRLSAAGGLADYLRFHTGARIVSEPAEATFAVITDPLEMPPLSAFHQGEPQYPDRSTTLILEVNRFAIDWTMEGPGIRGQRAFSFEPAPMGFLAMAAGNRAMFPLGVDLLLAGPDAIAALPRSVRIREA